MKDISMQSFIYVFEVKIVTNLVSLQYGGTIGDAMWSMITYAILNSQESRRGVV